MRDKGGVDIPDGIPVDSVEELFPLISACSLPMPGGMRTYGVGLELVACHSAVRLAQHATSSQLTSMSGWENNLPLDEALGILAQVDITWEH